MLWLLVAILAYFLFAIVALGDKYLLGEKIPNPKVYSFYVGLLGILALFLIPLGFSIPKPQEILLSIFAGALFIFALFFYYTGLRLFEASRIVPAIGGILPIFTFFLTFFLPLEKKTLTFPEVFAFILLIFGSILISLEKKRIIGGKSLQFAILVAFLFALAFISMKFVYNFQSFWSGFIWMRIGGFFAAFFLLFSQEVRQEIFQKRITFQKKTGIFFLSNQALGATGFIFQNWAIALASIIYLPLINALQGIQYAFLFIFATLISLKFPKIIKEKISKRIIYQKIFAILLIIIGFFLLAFKK